jgi:hypothetical protein
MMVSAEPVHKAKYIIEQIRLYGFVSVGFFNNIIINIGSKPVEQPWIYDDQFSRTDQVMSLACEPSPEIIEFFWENVPSFRTKIRQYIIKYKDVIKLDVNHPFIMAIMLGAKND